MGSEESGRQKKSQKWWLLLIIVVAFFIVIALAIIGLIVFEIKYKYEFFPGSRIGNISLEGLNREQALALITPMADKIERDGIEIRYQNDSHNLNLTGTIDSLSDPDLSREVLYFDEYKTIYESFKTGHDGSLFKNIGDQWSTFWGVKNFKADFVLDEDALNKILKAQFGKNDQSPKNATPKITWAGNSYKIEIENENPGSEIDYQKAIDDLKNNFLEISDKPILLTQKITEPTVTADEITGKTGDIDFVLNSSTPKFSYADKNWQMDKKKLSQMIEFQKVDNEIKLGLNHDLFIKWFTDTISAQINVEPKNAQIEIKDGQATKISTHQEGLKADAEKAYADVQGRLMTAQWPVAVEVVKIAPDVATDNINDMGIKEIIGVGESDFKGSPSNRIHNIKNGASKVHGILIKPGEEFSLINTLGEVEKSTGYLPELVIKGNKTMPEYGGGLCQVGTTMFRAAMGSGLPITERRNHSYNVTYYLENGLPGVDATIYIPHPDVRFINNTGNYVLIQTRVEGTKLKFEFWGTKDGRQATRTKPKAWDWVSPPPTKYVETTELKPGQKKCTESAHKGVKASFDYIVTSTDGTVKRQNFYSVYKPWQAVCLIGVDPNKAVATSTEVIIGTPENPVTTTTSVSN